MPRQSPEVPPADAALTRLLEAPQAQPLVLLHSGRRHERWATRSLLGRPRAVYRYWIYPDRPQGESELLWLGNDEVVPHVDLVHHVWTDLRTILQFPGKWIGCISYDIARLIEPAKLRPYRPGVEDWPVIELTWCPPPEFEEIPVLPQAGPEARRRSGCNADCPSGAFTANFTREAYESAVRRVLDYIAAGDIFQANIAQRFTGTWRGDPRKLYQRLATVSPAWYGAYLELGDAADARVLLSTSPELFLEVTDRRVVTRPIKGTRPARSGGREELLHSEKDTAELNMIVDLMRNDLGKVCAYGSVKVDVPREIESHPTIHHGVATITGTLHESKDIVDLLRATLPGGSVTGAPKVRAMQIIDEIEPHPRGPYCGCIGWLSKDACQLNVAIRTILLTPAKPRDIWKDEPLNDWQASFSVGGGIVADSNPAAEYEETLTKAAAMQRALSTPSRT